jgi:hypothetical protein
MKKLYSGNIFADHSQFYLLEGSFEVSDSLYDWNLENGKLGYINNYEGIAILTLGDSWVYWIEAFLSQIPPTLEDCERALVFNINTSSGGIKLRSPAFEVAHLSVSPGQYAIYILCYNLGKDSEEELSDEELERRTDLERYKIVLVPGKTTNEGVIKGSKYLPDCVFDEE